VTTSRPSSSVLTYCKKFRLIYDSALLTVCSFLCMNGCMCPNDTALTTPPGLLLATGRE